MPWVKFDDGFDDDPDLDFMTEGAVALNLCAETWASRNGTDGFVPEARARKLFGYSPEAIDCLLTKCAPGNQPWWLRVEGGYQIRNFLKFNPSAEEVEQVRAANADRKAKWRAEQRQLQRDNSHSHIACHEGTDGPVTENVTAGQDASVTHPVTAGRTTPTRIPYPVSQDPETHIPESRASATQLDEGNGRHLSKPPTRKQKSVSDPVLEELFDRFWAAYPRRAGPADKADAKKKFMIALGQGEEPEEIIAGTERYAKWARAEGKEGTGFVKQAATFLSKKCWPEEFPVTVVTTALKEQLGPDPDRRKPIEGVDYHIAIIKTGPGAGSAGRFEIEEDGEMTSRLFSENAWRAHRNLPEVANV